MDRVTTVLSRHRMLPFVLPTLVCACWLTGCTQTAAPEKDRAAASSDTPGRPGLLPADDLAGDLARPGDLSAAVMPASFPEGRDVWKRLDNDVWWKLEDFDPGRPQGPPAPAPGGEPSTIAIHE